MKPNKTMPPLPEKMQSLPIDRRGFPIPYVVLIDGEGTPHFTVNDSNKIFTALKWKFCAICGKSMKTDMWMVGGIGSALHEYGVYNDTPVHYECGRYALEVCPYLASKTYNKYLNPEALKKRIKGEDIPILVDQTVDPNKPKLFAFQKISGFRLRPNGHGGFYIVPTRPYLELQFWTNGAEVPFNEALSIVESEGYKIDETILKKTIDK